MRFPTLVMACLALATGACNESKPPPPDAAVQPKDTIAVAAAPQPYFPVFSFLNEEISYVDSLPVGIKKYRMGTRTDSGYISLEEFHRFVNEFLSPDLKDSAFTKKYKETSFVDRSNGNATFMYSASDDASAIKRVDVVTAKGNVYDEVKSLYMERHRTAGDSTIVKKLMWKPKRNFQMITVTTAGSRPPKDELIKVVWDNREEP